MWHEARKQEKMIRGMIVDYRRRAERRKDFYEKIKAEPTQFLQLHGRPCKIHLDPAIAAAGEGPAIMMPWQGNSNNMIDRFDVRAHLDYIPEVKNPFIAPEDLTQEERQCNYERYRILAQNAFLGISEEKFLQQLAIEEQFGVTIEEKEMQKERLNEKKGTGAAIGYNYNDPGAQPSCSNPIGPEVKKTEQQEDSDDDSDLEIIDVDLSIDVNKMEASQAHELNSVGPLFGMAGCDLFSFLTGDADDAEHQKQLLREEKEKAMFSGRKSRRERRAHRDKKLMHRVVSPPSYAAPRSPARAPSRTPSRSPSPEAGHIQFITSFGGDDEEVKTPAPARPLYADKLKQNLKPEVLYSDVARKPPSRLVIDVAPVPGTASFHGPAQAAFKVTLPLALVLPLPIALRLPLAIQVEVEIAVEVEVTAEVALPNFTVALIQPPQKVKVEVKLPPTQLQEQTFAKPAKVFTQNEITPGRYHMKVSRRVSPLLLQLYIFMNSSNDKGQGQSKPVPRYYGRRKEDKSSSELSVDSDSSDTPDDTQRSLAVKPNSNQNQLRLSGSSSKVSKNHFAFEFGSARETKSLKEKLKKKMQAQLSRQLRADKRAEAERLERESRRQARRDEEMRELAIKLRRKSVDPLGNVKCGINRTGDRVKTTLTEATVGRPDKNKDEDSHSKSPSPEPKRIPVWETNREAPREPPPDSYRHKYDPGESSYYPPEPPRRRFDNDNYYKDERSRDDDRPPGVYPPNRYDKYPNREYQSRNYDNRQEYNQSHDSRWDQDSNYSSSRRRPYGYRGGYRGQSNRPGPEQNYEDPPRSWHTRQETHGDHDRDSSYNKSKVKLVDY
ncbi:hypothetical protein MSG28_004641 [Choristoneura fumiferana]|uniref:Uncharacterized protein n=1 Tax=Choristoneura fumiferana TaxID=7141 RepID=A0ACC0K711_CHOFU|nr:hypothetical protein MSG28_004641 [Choristoneura fumiferana]